MQMRQILAKEKKPSQKYMEEDGFLTEFRGQKKFEADRRLYGR